LNSKSEKDYVAVVVQNLCTPYHSSMRIVAEGEGRGEGEKGRKKERFRDIHNNLKAR